ncbi:hypothetical protein GCM10028798_02310 [Humibacter antri]
MAGEGDDGIERVLIGHGCAFHGWRSGEDIQFTGARGRGDVDRSGLPRDTSLQRAIQDKLDVGGHWRSLHGILEQGAFR